MSPSIVVDASVALKWVLPETDSGRALSLRNGLLHAPDLLLAECGDALWTRLRRGVLSRSEAEICYATLDTAPFIWATTGDLAAEAYALSLDLDHPVYDCIYLALAISRDLPLVTADKRLLAVAERRSAISQYLIPLHGID